MQTLTAPADALRIAIERIGSQSQTARLLGVSQAAVWKWVSKGKALPSEHVLTVERETGVSKHLLRPDIYPTEHPATPAGDPSHSVGGGGAIVCCDRAAPLQRAS